MRLVPIALCAFALAGCVSPRYDVDGTIQTPQEANREGLTGAASAPLRDLNVVRTKIPPILLQAYADPYARPAEGCAGLVAEVQGLNEAMGSDLDEPPSEEGDLIHRASDTAFGAMAGAASDLIPLRGWVRKLTGAERHSRLVNDAITAGGVRRAYLKGLGEARGCNPPGTPKHTDKPPEVIEQQHGPRYPIH